MNAKTPYHRHSQPLADLKAAVYEVLANSDGGLKNVQIGRALGIYGGHKGQHVGHIPRTILEMMQGENVVRQDEDTKLWYLNDHLETPGPEETEG